MAGPGEGMITLKLKKGDQEKLQRALEAQLKKVNMNTPIVLAQAGHKGADYCKKTAPCPVDTGRLRGTIGNPGYINKKQGKGGGIFKLGKSSIFGGATGVMFGTAVEYAHPVEKRTHFMLQGVTAAVPDMVNILTGVMR